MTANIVANVHATGKHKDSPVFERLRPLLEDYPSPCLSLYQPTFRAFPDCQQNAVRYKNLVKELKAALEKTPETDYESLPRAFRETPRR